MVWQVLYKYSVSSEVLQESEPGAFHFPDLHYIEETWHSQPGGEQDLTWYNKYDGRDYVLKVSILIKGEVFISDTTREINPQMAYLQKLFISK